MADKLTPAERFAADHPEYAGLKPDELNRKMHEHPEYIGGLQALICADCGKEITREQSLQYRIEDSKRIHYPNCD